MANISGINPPVLNDQDYVDKISDSFTAVDEHDHSAGKGLPVAAGGIAAGAIVNADINANAAIARTKVANGTADHVVINNGSGTLSSEAQLAKARGGTGADNSSVTFPSTGTIVTRTETETLSNKTLTTPVISESLEIIEDDTIASPSAGRRRLFVKTDGNLYLKNSSGVETVIGSGGGGGSLILHSDGADAPAMETLFSHLCYSFGDGLSQNLYTLIRVPSSYVSGKQITMKFNHFHQALSATQLLRTQATLLQPGDTFDDTSNQRTSTNSAQTGAEKIIVAASCDITDSSGLINGATVEAGDLIKVRLYRDTDTSTADVHLLASSVEVIFQ